MNKFNLAILPTWCWRVITAAVLLFTLFALKLNTTNVVFSFCLMPIVAIATWEWARLLQCSKQKACLYACLVLIITIAFYTFQSSAFPKIISQWITPLFWVSYPIFAFFSGVKQSFSQGMRYGLLLAGLLLFPAVWFIIFSLQEDGPVLLALLCLIWIFDTTAYCFGNLFGKHLLCPKISPGKTWEGVFAGLFFSCLFIYGIEILIRRAYGVASLVPDPITMITAIMTVIAAIIGDLFISWMKRHAQVKDSGCCLPGHGGVLDRVDSLLAAFPIFYFLMHHCSLIM